MHRHRRGWGAHRLHAGASVKTVGAGHIGMNVLPMPPGARAKEQRFRAWLQWIAEEQWQAARRAAGVRVLGDLPFMISGDSPDVWTRREQFRLDATVGVPPDAFSDTGQDWGLPPWRWDVMRGTGFQWMRARARRTAALFDGVRIDHLVGLYRIYVRPLDASAEKVFSPADEPTQSQLGATLLNIYLGSGLEVVAEDLGTVPDFVRWSMARLGVLARTWRWLVVSIGLGEKFAETAILRPSCITFAHARPASAVVVHHRSDGGDLLQRRGAALHR